MIHQIFISAAIVVAIIFLIEVAVCKWAAFSLRKVIIPFLTALPFSAIVNILIKSPLIYLLLLAHGLSLKTGILSWPISMIVAALLVVGFSEEGIKLSPLTSGTLRNYAKNDTLAKIMIAWSVGMGFGTGEALYIAYMISIAPVYAGMPFYYFTGYIIERILASIIHGTLAVITYWGLSTSRKLLMSYTCGSLIHSLIDVPAMLCQIRLLDIILAENIIFLEFIALFLFFLLLTNKYKHTSEKLHVTSL